MFDFLKSQINEPADAVITLAELVQTLPPDYVAFLESQFAYARARGVDYARLQSFLFDERYHAPASFSNSPEHEKAEHDLWYNTYTPFYSAPHEGLTVEGNFFAAGFTLKVGPFVRDQEGNPGIHWSQFDVCSVRVDLSREGLTLNGLPCIFGAVSSDYGDWSRYYGDPRNGVRGRHPENRLPHNRFILKLISLVAQRHGDMDAAFFHHVKNHAFDTMFKTRMPGMVGVFHGAQGELFRKRFYDENAGPVRDDKARAALTGIEHPEV